MTSPSNGNSGVKLNRCRIAAYKVLPFNVRARVHMQNCEFGFGDQSDLQGMNECDFTGFGKTRRVKNGFYFDCFKEAALTHNSLLSLHERWCCKREIKFALTAPYGFKRGTCDAS
jgi:hypothetical protein